MDTPSGSVGLGGHGRMDGGGKRCIVTMIAQILAVLGGVALAVTTLQPKLSAAALKGAELYRAAIEWHNLSNGVYQAFLGDQKVMQDNMDVMNRAVGGLKVKADGKRRGVVIPAGGMNQLTNAYVNVHVLRYHLKCQLPVTIAYWGVKKKEVPEEMREIFGTDIPDVQFLDLSKLPYPAHHRWLSPPDPNVLFNGFKVKVFALYAAPYDEVLLMDSDSMALQDPTGLFEDDGYKKYGNMFWPDRWCVPVKLHKLLGMHRPASEAIPQTDSGQFLFHRSRHPEVLDWLLFLNTHNEFTYRYAHGDKDTYEAAFFLASKGEVFYQVEQPLSVALSPGLLYPVPRGFVQHHPNNSLAFIHRTSLAKYSAHENKGRMFSHILLQPSCSWSRKFWHFFAPMVSVSLREVRVDRCSMSFYDTRKSLEKCHMKTVTKSPYVIEIQNSSYVKDCQRAADAAHDHLMGRLSSLHQHEISSNTESHGLWVKNALVAGVIVFLCGLRVAGVRLFGNYMRCMKAAPLFQKARALLE